MERKVGADDVCLVIKPDCSLEVMMPYSEEDLPDNVLFVLGLLIAMQADDFIEHISGLADYDVYANLIDKSGSMH